MNKIIALWAHPRSMSTAFERVMRESGQVECLHEPFMYDYYVHRQVRKMPFFDVDPDHPVTYDQVREKILALAETKAVFSKDMSYYVLPQILEDKPFLDRLTNVFLIRHPESSIASYHKLDANLSVEEVGIEAQHVHFTGLKQRGYDPILVSAEEVRNHPRKIMQQVFDKIGLAFDPAFLNWSDEKPGDWEQVETWHAKVLNSTGIKPDTQTPQERRAKFAERAQADPRLWDLLDHHLAFYEQLMEARIKP